MAWSPRPPSVCSCDHRDHSGRCSFGAKVKCLKWRIDHGRFNNNRFRAIWWSLKAHATIKRRDEMIVSFNARCLMMLRSFANVCKRIRTSSVAIVKDGRYSKRSHKRTDKPTDARTNERTNENMQKYDGRNCFGRGFRANLVQPKDELEPAEL